MKTKFKPIAFVICLIIVATHLQSACGGKSEDQISGGDVLAIVGDTEIKSNLVDGMAAFLMYMNYGEEYNTLTEEEGKTEWRNQVLVYLCAETEMIKNYFKQKDVEPLTDDDKELIEKNIEEVYASAEGMETTLSAMGVSKAHLEYYFEGDAYYTAYNDEILENNPVSDEEVNAYYEENKESYVSAASIRASHILMADADHGETTRAAIEAVLAKAQAGEDFAELAKTYSEDGSAAEGGDLGFFAQDGSMVAEFEDAAFALGVGEISGIVETEFGYHIIKVTDSQAEEQQPFEMVKDDIRTTIENDRVAEALTKLREESTVEYKVDVSGVLGETTEGGGE
jgi:parvulin-like peptidyl-prolyl isomerase